MSPETLRELLSYDPETGVLTWKSRSSVQWNTRFAGRPALACPDKDGYLKGSVLGKYVKAHRVAWAIHYGQWPEIVDHINGNIADNRIANLRSVNERDSHRNLPKYRKNRSGIIGVMPDGNRWRAYMTIDGRAKTLGRFDSIDEAAAARKEAETTFGFHRNHGREPRASAA